MPTWQSDFYLQRSCLNIERVVCFETDHAPRIVLCGLNAVLGCAEKMIKEFSRHFVMVNLFLDMMAGDVKRCMVGRWKRREVETRAATDAKYRVLRPSLCLLFDIHSCRLHTDTTRCPENNQIFAAYKPKKDIVSITKNDNILSLPNYRLSRYSKLRTDD